MFSDLTLTHVVVVMSNGWEISGEEGRERNLWGMPLTLTNKCLCLGSYFGSGSGCLGSWLVQGERVTMVFCCAVCIRRVHADEWSGTVCAVVDLSLYNHFPMGTRIHISLHRFCFVVCLYPEGGSLRWSVHSLFPSGTRLDKTWRLTVSSPVIFDGVYYTEVRSRDGNDYY